MVVIVPTLIVGLLVIVPFPSLLLSVMINVPLVNFSTPELFSPDNVQPFKSMVNVLFLFHSKLDNGSSSPF